MLCCCLLLHKLCPTAKIATEKATTQQEREGRPENRENTKEEEGYREEEEIEEERKGWTGGRNFKKKRLGWGGSGVGAFEIKGRGEAERREGSKRSKRKSVRFFWPRIFYHMVVRCCGDGKDLLFAEAWK